MGDNKIDITSTAVEKGLDLVKGFLDKLIGAPIEEYGLILADNVRLRRFKNQIRIVGKAQKMVEESGINIKQISIKTLVPLLEYSSLEDDETIQDKWSNMIVNFVDSTCHYESSVFPSILNQLSSKEIILMDKLEQDKVVKSDEFESLGIYKSNLIRLGLIEADTAGNKIVKTFRNVSKMIPIRYNITELGEDFVKCCTR